MVQQVSIMRFNCVDKAISVLFKHLGVVISRHPTIFVVIPIVVSCILVSGTYFLQRLSDVNYLYSPINGRSATDRKIIQSLYLEDSSNYDWIRSVTSDPFAMFNFVTETNHSILHEQHFRSILRTDRIVRNITVQWNGRLWNYSDLCALNNNECIKQPILQEADRILKNGTWLKYPMEVNGSSSHNALYTALNLGGVEVDEEERVVHAKAARIFYFLDGPKEAIELWQHRFLQSIENIRWKGIRISEMASVSISEELERNAKIVMPLCTVAVIMMITFGVSVCLTRDWIRAKPWLGIAGCVSASLGVMSSFGVILFSGYCFNDIVTSVPYLMLGIGMDDTFVLLAAWRRTNPKDSVETRMGAAYSEAAVSITITSVTNFVSFLIGLTTPFPVVRIFCTYTAVAVFFSYIYQITFFGGCMALSGYREEKRLHPFTFEPVLSQSSAGDRGLVYRLLCTGPQRESCNNNDDFREEYAMMVFLRDQVGELISKPFAKALILIGFFCYIAIALFGCWKLEEGLEYTSIFPYDSYLILAYQDQNRYFYKYRNRLQIAITEPIDYSDPILQERIENFLTKLESSQYFGNSYLTESWLRYYLDFAQKGRFKFLMHGFDLNKKEDFIDGLKQVFLKFPASGRFNSDVVFNENSTDIISSRFILQVTNVNSSVMEKDMLVFLYETIDECKLPIAVYGQFLPLIEQQILVRTVCIQTVGIAAVIMMIIFLLFIPNLTCAICVAFSIVSIELGVIGYMSLWSVRLDTVSMINLIMCIGFSVDYSSHISYVFQTCQYTDPKDKIKWSLYSVGTPIINGCLSTILGVLILSFTPSYLFLVFFKIVFLVILFAALHGLFLLPVLLSIFDCTCKRKEEKKEIEPVNGHEVKTLINPEIDKNCRRRDSSECSDRGSCKNEDILNSKELSLDETEDEERNDLLSNGTLS